MPIYIIAALSKNRCIGKNNSLPWHISADLQRFKKLTSNNTVIMGRKTFDSIGRALPNRLNIVLSRDPTFSASGIKVCSDLNSALQPYSATKQTIFIMGGEQIYRLSLPFATRLYLTEVDCEVVGDAFFPQINEDNWHIVEASKWFESNLKYRFVVFERNLYK